MKKYILLVLLAIGLAPGWDTGRFAITAGQTARAQTNLPEVEVCVTITETSMGEFGGFEIWDICTQNIDCDTEEYIEDGYDCWSDLRSAEGDEEHDCNGDPGGTAYMAWCGCVGGNTGIEECPPTTGGSGGGGGGSSGGGSSGGGVTPCAGDVIRNPTIAPTPAGLNGGRYGWTRMDGTKFHDGIDIRATPGTSTFAVYAGIVVASESSFQPGEYKKTSYGNYIAIQTTLNDGTVLILKYNHLNGVNVTNGTIVSQGSIIGQNGTTGNAARADVIPHVHIQARTVVNGDQIRQNPENYLATKYNNSGMPTGSPCNP